MTVLNPEEWREKQATLEEAPASTLIEELDRLRCELAHGSEEFIVGEKFKNRIRIRDINGEWEKDRDIRVQYLELKRNGKWRHHNWFALPLLGKDQNHNESDPDDGPSATSTSSQAGTPPPCESKDLICLPKRGSSNYTDSMTKKRARAEAARKERDLLDAQEDKPFHADEEGSGIESSSNDESIGEEDELERDTKRLRIANFSSRVPLPDAPVKKRKRANFEVSEDLEPYENEAIVPHPAGYKWEWVVGGTDRQRRARILAKSLGTPQSSLTDQCVQLLEDYVNKQQWGLTSIGKLNGRMVLLEDYEQKFDFTKALPKPEPNKPKFSGRGKGRKRTKCEPIRAVVESVS